MMSNKKNEEKKIKKKKFIGPISRWIKKSHHDIFFYGCGLFKVRRP